MVNFSADYAETKKNVELIRQAGFVKEDLLRTFSRSVTQAQARIPSIILKIEAAIPAYQRLGEVITNVLANRAQLFSYFDAAHNIPANLLADVRHLLDAIARARGAFSAPKSWFSTSFWLDRSLVKLNQKMVAALRNHNLAKFHALFNQEKATLQKAAFELEAQIPREQELNKFINIGEASAALQREFAGVKKAHMWEGQIGIISGAILFTIALGIPRPMTISAPAKREPIQPPAPKPTPPPRQSPVSSGLPPLTTSRPPVVRTRTRVAPRRKGDRRRTPRLVRPGETRRRS